MKTKLSIILGIIFLIGIIGFASANTLSDVSATMTIPSKVIAGNSFLANFSFNYLSPPNYQDKSALIIKLNITSSDQINYPVWKNDFKINGYAKKCQFDFLGRCWYWKTIPFPCTESNQSNQVLIINNILGNYTDSNVRNGTFYCFNELNYLELNEGDNIFLNITSNIAIWPGNYTINASMFYIEDTLSPFVKILDKSYFNQYFRDGSDVDFNANVSDFMGLIETPSATIISSIGNTNFSVNTHTNNIYEFLRTLPVNIPEGYWTLIVRATDNSGNIGNDSVTIKIDRTGPIINALQPQNNSIISDILPIELNVTDAKSGVNENSIYYRLREMNGTIICPEHGTGSWNCYNSGWVNVPYNSTSGFYEASINTTQINLTSGQYWFESKAYDNLGNLGILN